MDARRMIAVFAIVTLLTGCADGGLFSNNRVYGFSCTQDAVCFNEIDPDSYGFFAYVDDSGILIPGLEQNFVPQGIGYWKNKNWLILSGYFKPLYRGAEAVLLAVDAASGMLVGEYSLVDERGRAYSGHFAGIAITRRDLYVTGDRCLYRVPLVELTRIGKKGAAVVAETIPIDGETSSCNYSDGVLWVCEHYQKTNYPLQGKHVMENNDGGIYHAWMIGYRVANSGALKPYCVFSVPDRIQGITALRDGRLVLSQSYGRTKASSIFICDDPRNKTPDGYVTVDGDLVPLWYLDQANGMEQVSAPPMSEGCCAVGDRVYVIFESGAYCYRAMEPGNTAVDPTDKIWSMYIQ